jgi:hypothetical protein
MCKAGDLRDLSFLIAILPLTKSNGSVGILKKKSKFFHLKFSKIEIFQKFLPSKFRRRPLWKIFHNGGTVQDGGFSTFYRLKSTNK